MTNASPHVRIPGDDPWRYAISLADRNKESLGFLPRTIYQPCYERGRLYVSQHEGDPCGFLLRGPSKKTLRIYQTCVAEDLRLLEYGSDLVDRLIDRAREAEVHQISLWCAHDLAANDFWRIVGFQEVEHAVPRRRADRPHNRWQLDLPAGVRHRHQLDASPQEQARDALMRLFGQGFGNHHAIARDRARRRE